MPTPTTIRKTIRQQMRSVIEALTPDTDSSVKFRVELGAVDFRTWAQTESSAPFRRFSVRFIGSPSPPAVSDLDIELVEDDRLELLVAYPKQWGKYGGENERSMDDVIDEDERLIDGNNGVSINNMTDWVSGQHNALCVVRDRENDPDLPVAFLRLEYLVQYYRPVSA